MLPPLRLSCVDQVHTKGYAGVVYTGVRGVRVAYTAVRKKLFIPGQFDGIRCRGTKVLEPGYEDIGAGVRGY